MARRIAVVVVHGVGDPGAGTSARKIASMLLDLKGAHDATLYKPFYESPVRIGVRPVRTDEPDAGAKLPNAQRRTLFNETGPYVAGRHEGNTESHLSPDIGYTYDQLQEYSHGSAEDTYETIRLSGEKRARAAEPSKIVHIYELYWADLVTVGKGLRLLGDAYQMMLHLASVGQHAIDMGRCQNPHSKCWKLFDIVHDAAVRLLCLPLPIFNLLLLSAAMTTLAATLPIPAVPYVAWGILNVLTVTVCGVALFIFNRSMPAWTRAGIWLSSIITVSGVIWTAALCPYFRLSEIAVQRLLAVEVFVLTIAALQVVFRAYAQVRLGPFLISTIASGITICIGMYEIIRCQSMVIAGLHVSECLWLLLLYGWVLLFIASVASWFVGIFLERFAPPIELSCARRAVWTARLSLSVPTVLFFVLTLTIWAGIDYAGRSLLQYLPYQHGDVWNILAYPAKLLRFPLDYNIGLDGADAKKFATQLWTACAGWVLAPVAGLTCVAALLAIWSLCPSVIAELRVPRRPGQDSVAFGRWLDGGFPMLRVAGEIMFLASLAIVPLGLIAVKLNQNPQLQNLPLWTFVTVGTLIAGSVGIRLLPGRVGKGFSSAAVPLRAALDVDAYLRLHPRRANPKAMIFARFVSLMRYLGNWTDPTDPTDPVARYDKVVIVSHSQGTVITADLFRFLDKFHDPSLNRFSFGIGSERGIPIHLFTMGCPLRQLYGRRFPHLYWWTEHNTATPVVSGGAQPLPIAPILQPDPSTLNVVEWVNAYRSGDYIGRNLWCQDSLDATWKPKVPSTNSPVCNQKEYCIGGGAHTHYWDESAPLIAEEIDRLIT